MLQQVAQPRKLFSVLGNDLSHRGHPSVALGQQVAPVLVAQPSFFQSRKRGIILIHTTILPVVLLPEMHVGNALQGGSEDFDMVQLSHRQACRPTLS